MTAAANETDSPRASQPDGGQLRIDKWLWFARVVKSRTLAAGLVEDGKVRLNRERTTKPSQTVRIGDILTVSVGPRVRVLEISRIGTRRGPASEAQALYIDRTPPPAAVAASPPQPAPIERPSGSGRPTKRDRRQIDRLTEGD